MAALAVSVIPVPVVALGVIVVSVVFSSRNAGQVQAISANVHEMSELRVSFRGACSGWTKYMMSLIWQNWTSRSWLSVYGVTTSTGEAPDSTSEPFDQKRM